MWRNKLTRAYVTAARKPPVTRTVSRLGTKPSPAASGPVSTNASATNSIQTAVPDEILSESAEFQLQSGQQRSVPSSSAVGSQALKGKPLNEKFTATLDDQPETPALNEINWATSYFGIGSKPFSESVQQELAKSLIPEDIEIKPDGLIYLPEIKYRRILNRAFGPGGWGLVARSKTIVTDKLLTREYALICHGQLVSIARGEQDYFSPEGIPTATEGCKSNALMRCCKDLGIASELWDPNFIRAFKAKYCEDKFVEHVTTKRKRKIWKRKDRGVDYPYKLT